MMKNLPLLLLVLLAVAQFPACQSIYDSIPDFQSARERIKDGDAAEKKEEVNKIVQDFSQMRPQWHDEAIKTVDEDKTQVGQQALITLMDSSALKKDSQRQEIAGRLIDRDEDGSLEALYEVAQNRDELVNEELIGYFGEKRYKPSIPLIKEQVEGDKFVPESINALYRMQDSNTNAYILEDLGSKRDKPDTRLLALQTVESMEDESIPPRAVPVYEGIVGKYTAEPREVVVLAINGLGRWGNQSTSYEALRAVYENSEDEGLRETALAAMGSLRNLPPEAIREEYETALVDMDAALELIRNREREEAKPPEPEPVVGEPVRKPVVIRPPAYNNRYRAVMASRLDQAFGQELSKWLQNRIDNALKSYATNDKPKGRFIYRSYRKYYGGDDASIKERLGGGINHPGSLSIIVRNVMAEYDTDPLRVYALAEIFDIRRWQAETILKLVQKSRL